MVPRPGRQCSNPGSLTQYSQCYLSLSFLQMKSQRMLVTCFFSSKMQFCVAVVFFSHCYSNVPQFIKLIIERHQGCSQFLTLMSKAVMNIHAHYPVLTVTRISLANIPKMKASRAWGMPASTLLDNVQEFSKMAQLT